MANSIGDWLKRYWVWAAVVFLGLVAFLATALFPTGNSGPLKALKEAEEAAKTMRDAKAAELKSIDEKLETNIHELLEIKSIMDEEERLKQLAAFGNRSRT